MALPLISSYIFEVEIKNEQILGRVVMAIGMVDFIMLFVITYNLDVGIGSDTMMNQLKWVLINFYVPIILTLLIPVFLYKLLTNKFLLKDKYDDKVNLQIIKLFLEFSYLAAIFFSSVFYYILVVIPNIH